MRTTEAKRVFNETRILFWAKFSVVVGGGGSGGVIKGNFELFLTKALISHVFLTRIGSVWITVWQLLSCLQKTCL